MTSIGAPEPALQEPDDRFTETVHSEADRYDGSRTPADRQLLIWQLHEREQRTASDIARILGMNPYTVQAVIARRESVITDARMLLKANAFGFASDAIYASSEAAKRGKLEGISAMLDRLGVTEPPKSNSQVQVGVQVVLNGGSVPQELGLSPAKVTETSEGPQEQAVIVEMATPAPEPQPVQAQQVSTPVRQRKVTQAAKPPKLTKAGTPRMKLKPRKPGDIRK